MIDAMVITFESGPLKSKAVEVADDTLEYEVELLAPADNKIDPSAPVKTTRLRYRRSQRESNGAVVFYARGAS